MHDVLLRHVLGDALNAPEKPPADDVDASLRRPPHSTEAEQSLLGGLILDASSFSRIADVVATGAFFAQIHQLIFDAIRGLVTDGLAVDLVSVFERLDRDGNAKAVGGLPYLNALVSSVPSSASLSRYAEIVAERARLREIIATLDEATARAFRNEAALAIVDDAKVALGKVAQGRAAHRLPLLSLAELREQSHAVPWLVKHVLPAASIGMMHGGSGTFKSFIALDAALHIAHGLPWMGRRTKQGAVLYIAAEGGSGLWPRIVAWHRSRRLSWKDVPLHVIPAAVDLTADAWRVVEAAQANGVTPALTIVDTLSQTFAGEENAAGEVAAYFRELGTRFRELWACAVLIVHHSGHTATERPRGSSAMRANVDFLLGVHRDEKEMLATLSCGKQKDGEAFKDASFSLSTVTLGNDEDGDAITSLVARHLSGAEAVREAMAIEARAGRGSHNHLLMSLAENGQRENELRDLFMKECGKDDPGARRQAWKRARDYCVGQGLIEVAQGVVILLGKGP